MGKLIQFWQISRVAEVLFGGVLLSVATLSSAQPATATGAQTGGTAMRAQLIGSWRLVSRESRRSDGELEPDPGLSTTPVGILIYDQSGHVAAQLSRRDRSVATIGDECRAAAATKGTPDTAQTVLG